MRALLPSELLVDGAIVGDHAVLVDGERIHAVLPTAALPADAERVELDGLLAPGFVDVQVNGGGGVLFNDAPTVEAIATIGAAHRTFGTTGFLPTLISDHLDVVRAGIAAVDAAIARGVPGVLGIHIEGPFLNRERKGIHDPARIRPLDEEGIAALTAPMRGVKLVTLAPDRTSAETIARLTAAGIVVAAGHTEASYEQMRAAADAGLRGLTHLWNAMPPLANRAPGPVGAALDDARLFAGLIADGHHVHPAAMRLTLAQKGAARTMLVSDAMPSVGMSDKCFDLHGRAIHARDGACFSDDGTLAGSDLDMATAVRRMVDLTGTDRPTALTMASATPAAFLGLDGVMGRLTAGHRADFVLLDRDGHVRGTWIGGHPTR